MAALERRHGFRYMAAWPLGTRCEQRESGG